MNLLLLIALVLFAVIIVWIYVLFVSSTINETEKKVPQPEISYEDVIERCNKLYEQGLHSELQRFAQRELSKNYGNVEIRKILAKSLIESGNEQMAIMHYEAVLSIAPYDLETQEFLANYYCENGPKSRAIELYEQIFMYDSGNVSAVETLAKLYEEVGNWDKAIEMYNMLLNAEVDGIKITELKYILADLYSKTGNNEKAFASYENIYESDPNNLEILMLLADLAYKNKFWQDCLKYYKKILSIVGDDFEMLEKVAQLQVTLENWPEAIEAYKKIISLEDENSSNYLYHQNELCNAMIKNMQYNEAIDILQGLLASNPKETSFAFTLAQAYSHAGKYQIGLNLYNKLLNDLPPEQSEIIIKYISNLICSWAQDLFKQGKYNQAFDKFFEALKYNEENDEVYYELGKCNYYIKSFQDSIAHFKRAISIKPQESNYYFGLGCAYDEFGSVKNAKIAFYDALNIDPMNIKARIAYAIMLTKELEYAQAIEQFLEILKYIPDNSDTMYNLALCYELVGDIERAIKYYKLAIDHDNNHKEANHNLELLLGEKYIPEKIEQVEPVEEIKEEIKEEVVEEKPTDSTPQLSKADEALAYDPDIFGDDALNATSSNNNSDSDIKYDDSFFK